MAKTNIYYVCKDSLWDGPASGQRENSFWDEPASGKCDNAVEDRPASGQSEDEVQDEPALRSCLFSHAKRIPAWAP
jgi:hypothetical protein